MVIILTPGLRGLINSARGRFLRAYYDNKENIQYRVYGTLREKGETGVRNFKG